MSKKLSKECSDMIYHIDTGSNLTYLEKVTGDRAKAIINQLNGIGLLDIKNDWIKVRWRKRNVRFLDGSYIYD